MKILVFILMLMLMASSAFACNKCNKTTTTCAGKVINNVASIGFDAPSEDNTDIGYFWSYDRLNLLGRVGMGARFVAYPSDGSSVIGSLTVRFNKNIYGIFEAGNRHLNNVDREVINGGALLIFDTSTRNPVTFKIAGGDRGVIMGLGVGF